MIHTKGVELEDTCPDERSVSRLSRQLSFASRRNNTLIYQPSKLDLIDDTTLTSLPLPPPPRTRHRPQVLGEPLHGSEQSLNLRGSTSSNAPTPQEEYEIMVPEITEDESFFEEDESEDPIVLVEDYMSSNGRNLLNSNSSNNGYLIKLNQQHLQRKKSLATFKLKLFSQNDDNYSISGVSVSTTSTIDGLMVRNSRGNSNLTHSITDKSGGIYQGSLNMGFTSKSSTTLERMEEVFGKIPGTDTLNYCDLCEKPLYELSAIINKRQMKGNHNLNGGGGGGGGDHESGDHEKDQDTTTTCNKYEEFVCWECVENYEQFYNELFQNNDELEYQNDIEDSIEKTEDSKDPLTNKRGLEILENSNERIIQIFKDIQKKYSTNNNKRSMASGSTSSSSSSIPKVNESPKRVKVAFSKGLIDKLQNLSDIPADKVLLEPTKSNESDKEWLQNIQQKLRWRWRFQGLLPSVLNKVSPT